MSINTEERERLTKVFRDYVSASVKSQECHDNIEMAVYPNRKNIKNGKRVRVKEVIEDIRNDESRNRVSDKTELSVGYFSATGFRGRKQKQNVIRHTGLVIIDIDKDKNLNTDFQELRKQFRRDRYVHAFFRSPSGGVKVIFNTDLNAVGQHYIFYEAIRRYVVNRYHDIHEVDSSGSDVNRACYLPYDTDAYYNPYSYRIALTADQKKKIAIEVASKKPSTPPVEALLQVDSLTYDQHFENIMQLLKKRTSVGIAMNADSTPINHYNLEINILSKFSNNNRTSLGMYDNIFNELRFQNWGGGY